MESADETARQLELNFRGIGKVKTKQHGEIKASVYKSYVEFVTLLKHLSKNTLGVEISYTYQKEDLLKILIENSLKSEASEKDLDYGGNFQNTLESMYELHTTRDLDLSFTHNTI